MRALKISLLVFTISIYGQTIQWQETNMPYGHAIMYLASNSSGYIFASRVGDFGTGKVYRTTDMGDTWTLQDIGLLPSFSHILAVNSDDIVFAGGQEGINYSTNNGGSWMTTAPTGIGVVAMGIDLNNDIYFSGSIFEGGYFYKSTDNGSNWIPLSNGLDSYGVNDIAFSNDGYIYAAAYSMQLGNGKVFYSTNHGGNWFPTGMNFFNHPNNIIVTINGDIFTTLYTGYIYRSTNHGATWDLVSNSLHDLSDLATNQIGHVFVSKAAGGIHRSTNIGDSWEPVNDGLTALYIASLTIDPLGFVYTGLSGLPGSVFRTTSPSIPVELISFLAEFSDRESEINLNWSTATETNNSGFEILRFAQNDKWNKIGFVPGHGTTTETQHYSFIDNNVTPGKYQYKLKQIDYDGMFEYSQIVEVEIPFVNEFSLSQNYPNPFNPTTSMQYTISSRQFVTLKVFDLLGREVATLVSEEKPAGEYEVEFNISNLSGGISAKGGYASGVYFYQFKAGEFTQTKKMVLMK